ncbi:MAG TPA: ROK family protein, partial [Candidatus Dormibacteraeota bacterium]|nr:ROK family protein [Candidatus Dormibacteraeota bacterium]
MDRMKHCKSQRERDVHVIEALLRKLGPLSQVEIHELTHFQRSAISGLVRDLLKQERLVEAGRSNNSRGRKQVLLRLNEDCGFVLGVGFDDEAVLAAVMNLHLRIVSLWRETTRLDAGIDELLHQVLSCAKKAIKDAAIKEESLLGIGVAGSGLVNSQEGTVVMSSTIEFLNQVPIRRFFEKRFPAPVMVVNLAGAKAVAERMLGAGTLADDMIYVEYGRTGIGAGIIS